MSSVRWRALLIALVALAFLGARHESARADLISPLDCVIVNQAGDLFPDHFDTTLNTRVVMIGIAIGGYIPYFYI